MLLYAAMAMCFVAIFLGAAYNPAAHSHELPPRAIFLILLAWLGFFGGWVTNLILGVVYAIKANRGEWATYPVIGKWLLPEKIPFEQ